MTDESKILEMMLDGNPSTYVLGPLAGLELGRFVPSPPPVYIIDHIVAELHPAWVEQIQNNCTNCEQRTLLIPGGEAIKSMAQLEKIYQWLGEQALPRDGTIVAIGGGTVTDLVGFAASTWRRGVNFVSIPTTLLAMVDAAIGGKTAINTGGVKNPVGTFHPARAILADVGFLGTLTCSDWRDGMAELIKTATIGDAALFSELYAARNDLAKTIGRPHGGEPVPGILGALPWRHWVGRAAAVKAKIVNRDFKEGGARKALNLGHTLGHALEAHSHLSPEPLSHGQAVAIGMAVVFRIAADRNLCPLPHALQMLELLEACGLPISWPTPPFEQLEKLLEGDKKTSGKTGLSWILPLGIGKVDSDAKVDLGELRHWLETPESEDNQ
jgi:3-dehydroquinate synthase